MSTIGGLDFVFDFSKCGAQKKEIDWSSQVVFFANRVKAQQRQTANEGRKK
jgi:hypothetical protein